LPVFENDKAVRDGHGVSVVVGDDDTHAWRLVQLGSKVTPQCGYSPDVNG
jgi:hypothetical protein